MAARQYGETLDVARVRVRPLRAGAAVVKGPAIRLHALNLSERVRQRFEHLFDAAGRGAGLLVNESVAEVVLVDMDAPGAARHLASYRERHPERPALMLAAALPGAAPTDHVLLKPVVIRALLDALQVLRVTVESLATPVPADEHEHAATVLLPGRMQAAVLGAAGAFEVNAACHGEAADDTPTVVLRRRSGNSPAGDAVAGAGQAGEPPTQVMARRAQAGEASTSGTASVDVATAAADPPTAVMQRVASAGVTDPRPAVMPHVYSTGVTDPQTAVMPRAAAAGMPAAAPAVTRAPGEDAARWAALCGTADDIDPEDDEAVASLWLSADGLLLPRLAAAARRALEEQRVLELRTGTLRITLDGASDYAYADCDEATVQALCAAGPVAGHMSVAPAGKPKAVLLSRSGTPTAHWPTLESAVWQVALWTYRGRLPAGTAVDERVYLSRWPNFTRLAQLPHALRIAALWVEQPLSLAATASMLGLPQRQVFAFYAATHALGSSGPARRGADNLFETSPAMLVPRRPLLGRLLHHLHVPVADDSAPLARQAG